MKKILLVSLLLAPFSAVAGHDDGNRMPAAGNAKWQEECSSCHIAYPPSLLPKASWQQLMRDLEHHFGQNASLDAAANQEITAFLVKNSSKKAISPLPTRITETTWFKRKHREVRASTWKRIGSPSNCNTCHKGAAQGDFSEENVVIPG